MIYLRIFCPPATISAQWFNINFSKLSATDAKCVVIRKNKLTCIRRTQFGNSNVEPLDQYQIYHKPSNWCFSADSGPCVSVGRLVGCFGLNGPLRQHYIGPSPREREKEKKNYRRTKKCPNNPHSQLLQAQ